MWPPISSARIVSACAAASSGVSANSTPPAFMRPPVSTCDLITVGAPISSAIRRASAAVFAKPCAETGMPALRTIWRDSYSKNRIGARTLTGSRAGRRQSTGADSSARSARVVEGCRSHETPLASRSRSATTRDSRAATWIAQPDAASRSHSRASRTSANVS